MRQAADDVAVVHAEHGDLGFFDPHIEAARVLCEAVEEGVGDHGRPGVRDPADRPGMNVSGQRAQGIRRLGERVRGDDAAHGGPVRHEPGLDLEASLGMVEGEVALVLLEDPRCVPELERQKAQEKDTGVFD